MTEMPLIYHLPGGGGHSGRFRADTALLCVWRIEGLSRKHTSKYFWQNETHSLPGNEKQQARIIAEVSIIYGSSRFVEGLTEKR